MSARSRIFLLSPATCSGARARLVMSRHAHSDLARHLRSPGGAPLGVVFAFLSGLYFRGKLAYARAFAHPPPGLPGLLVITPDQGLCPAEEPIGLSRLRAFARVRIDPDERRYRLPLLRDVGRMATTAGAGCEMILLGSVATGKYVDLLLPALGDRLRFPREFVGRGDMSRGSLLLRSVEAGRELTYVGVRGVDRRGPRPPRLARLGGPG